MTWKSPSLGMPVVTARVGDAALDALDALEDGVDRDGATLVVTDFEVPAEARGPGDDEPTITVPTPARALATSPPIAPASAFLAPDTAARARASTPFATFPPVGPGVSGVRRVSVPPPRPAPARVGAPTRAAAPSRGQSAAEARTRRVVTAIWATVLALLVALAVMVAAAELGSGERPPAQPRQLGASPRAPLAHVQDT